MLMHYQKASTVDLWHSCDQTHPPLQQHYFWRTKHIAGNPPCKGWTTGSQMITDGWMASLTRLMALCNLKPGTNRSSLYSMSPSQQSARRNLSGCSRVSCADHGNPDDSAMFLNGSFSSPWSLLLPKKTKKINKNYKTPTCNQRSKST